MYNFLCATILGFTIKTKKITGLIDLIVIGEENTVCFTLVNVIKLLI